MNLIKHHTIFWVYILFLIMTCCGCSDRTIIENTSSPTEKATSTLISKVERTITPSLEPTLTSTPIPEYQKIIQKCVQISPDFEGEKQPMGKLVFDGDDMDIDGMVLDLASKKTKAFKNSWEFDVSQDREKIVYKNKKTDEIILLDNKLNVVKKIASIKGKLRIHMGWLNNNEIKYDVYSGSDLYNGNELDPYLETLNPFSNRKEKYLLNQYPDFQVYVVFKGWDTITNMVLNPNKKYVIYPMETRDSFPFVLWDIDKKVEVARVYSDGSARTPEWNPEANAFVMNAYPVFTQEGKKYFTIDDQLPYKGGEDLYIVGLDGDVRRLTFYSMIDKSKMSGFKFSVDGHKLAFLLQKDLKDYQAHRFYLTSLDMETKFITDYCFSIEGPIVWSPDGKYLMVSVKEDKYYHSAYVVEVETGKAMKVAEHAIGKGWLK